ncbi:MAG: STAS domain-containing protein [Boseongicola sp.]|nr:STAS domain-containing protein [Boseongicola sp.]
MESDHQSVDPDMGLFSDDATGPLILPARLDTSASSDLVTDLKLREKSNLVLEGAQVEFFGAQCLEVLLNAKAYWEQNSKTMEIKDPSPALTKDLRQFGLELQDLQSGDAG